MKNDPFISFFFSYDCALSFAQSATPTLEEISEKIPEIGSFQSSEFVPPIGGKIILLNVDKFEVRFFFFQDTRTSDSTLSFKKYLKESKMANVPGRLLDLGYGQIIAFTPSDEEKEKGVHYMLSLRPLPLDQTPSQKSLSMAFTRKDSKSPTS